MPWVARCWTTYAAIGKRTRHWIRHAGGSWPRTHRGARRVWYGAHAGAAVAVVTCVVALAPVPDVAAWWGGGEGQSVPVDVPEPGTLLVFGVGVVALRWVRRW